MKFPLIGLLLLYFILLSEKMYFTAKIFNMHIISMGTDLNVCRGVFRTQTNIYGGGSLRKSQKSVIVDVRLGSKYVSSIGFTIENVYRSQYLFHITNSTLKICHCALVSPIKTHFGLTKKV